jgi:hypothetical protein
MRRREGGLVVVDDEAAVAVDPDEDAASTSAHAVDHRRPAMIHQAPAAAQEHAAERVGCDGVGIADEFDRGDGAEGWISAPQGVWRIGSITPPNSRVGR